MVLDKIIRTIEQNDGNGLHTVEVSVSELPVEASDSDKNSPNSSEQSEQIEHEEVAHAEEKQEDTIVEETANTFQMPTVADLIIEKDNDNNVEYMTTIAEETSNKLEELLDEKNFHEIDKEN